MVRGTMKYIFHGLERFFDFFFHGLDKRISLSEISAILSRGQAVLSESESLGCASEKRLSKMSHADLSPLLQDFIILSKLYNM